MVKGYKYSLQHIECRPSGGNAMAVTFNVNRPFILVDNVILGASIAPFNNLLFSLKNNPVLHLADKVDIQSYLSPPGLYEITRLDRENDDSGNEIPGQVQYVVLLIYNGNE